MLEKTYRYISLLSIRGGALVLKFLLTVFIARYIGLDTLGQYGLVIGLTLLFPSLLRFGVLQNVSREFVGHDSLTLTKHLSSYFLGTTLVYALLIPVGYFAFEFANLNELFTFKYLWLPLVVYFEHIISDIIFIFNTLGHTLRANIVSLLQATFNVLPIFLYYLLYEKHLTAEHLLSFWVVGDFLCIIFSILFWSKGGISLSKIKLDTAWYIQSIKKSSFLYINEFVSVFYAITDRYLIAFFMSLKFAGIYTFYLQLINAVFTLINSSVIQGHKSGILKGSYTKDFQLVHQVLKKMIVEATLLMSILSLVIALLIPMISRLVVKPELLEFRNIFFVLALIFIARVAYTCFAIALYALKKDWFLLQNTFFCIAINLGLVFFLVRLSDLYAVPIALFVSFVAGLLSCIYMYKKVIENGKMSNNR